MSLFSFVAFCSLLPFFLLSNCVVPTTFQVKSRFLSLCHHLNLYFLNIKSRKGSSWGGVNIYLYENYKFIKENYKLN